MIIEKDTNMLIYNDDRGEFFAKARRTFTAGDEYYPVIIVDPMEAKAIQNEVADLRGNATKVEVVESEIESEIENQDAVEPEIEMEFEEETTEAETPIVELPKTPESFFYGPRSGIPLYLTTKNGPDVRAVHILKEMIL